MPVPVFTSGEVLTAANMNQVGLWLVKTQTFSAAANCDVTSVFSSSFENYIAVIRLASSLTGNYNNLQLLDGATPKAVNYNRSGFVATTGNVLATDSGTLATTAWRFGLQSSVATYGTATFFRPFSTSPTGYSADVLYDGNKMGVGGVQTESYSATGFRILADAGAATYTGTVSVYGYND
jgi:hypothetical protein